MNTTRVLLAIDILFWIAAVAPVAVVVIYRLTVVPMRRAEILEITSTAFPGLSDVARRNETRKLLRDNPYICEPETAFEQSHSWIRYAFPLILLALLTFAIAYAGRAWVGARLGLANDSIAARIPAVIVMAFAGGYVWSVFQIVTRTGAGELAPVDLYEIDLGLLASAPIGYAFSLLTVELEGVRTFMAFAASAFPVREVSRLIRQYATRRMLESPGATAARPAERHLGTAIEGVSDPTLARLAEMRITTVLDMAYCDPIKVMVNSGFPLPVIIDWMDQSIWALYAGDAKSELTRHGLRCALDVCEFVDMHLRDAGGARRVRLVGDDRDALDAVARILGADATLVRDLLFRVYADPQVQVLRRLWYSGGVPRWLLADGGSAPLAFDAPDADALEQDADFWALYDATFPSTEREPHDVILDTLRAHRGFALRASAEGSTVGLATVHLLENPPAPFLVYLAVSSEFRSRGIGPALVQHAWTAASVYYRSHGRSPIGLVLEVDRPADAADAADRDVRERRVAFFERLGAHVCTIPYRQPPVDGVTTLPMLLMFRPAAGARTLDKEELVALTRALYSEKYVEMNGIPPEEIERLQRLP